jgi:hypothetical protein
LCVRRHIISKFVLWTLAAKTDKPLEMMLVAIPRAICMPSCENRCATPDVAIGIQNMVLPTLGVGILLKGGRLDYPMEYLVQHVPVCFQQLIQLLQINSAVLDWNMQECDHYDGVR